MTSLQRLNPDAVRMKLRPDLTAKERASGFTRRWMVKDPVALNHFEFTEDEWFLLQQLDGVRTLEEIRENYDSRYAPQVITLPVLQQFYTEAYQSGLIDSEGRNQADSLLERRHASLKQRVLFSPLSLLGMRFTFGDAQGILDFLRPVGRVLFSKGFALLIGLAMLVAIALGVGRAGRIAEMLPSFGDFFSQSNLWLLGLSWIVVKLLHELGHGLACRRFGGECHEFGVQLIVFFPFAYCNVSDAWMMPSKWQRMIVSAAGMYVELIIATLSMYLWYFSEPGLLNSLALNLVILCSINTVLFNGNPLLRFDGYYMLSDWLEVPNLHAQSKVALLHPIKAWLLPGKMTSPRYDGNRFGLASFGLLAFAYRLFTIGIIAWTVYQVLAMVNLAPLADLLVALLLIGLVIPAVLGCVRIMRHPMLRKSLRKVRLAVIAAGLAVIGFGILSCPWNRVVRAPVVVRLQDSARLYAGSPGRLVSHVELGEQVTQGQIVASLENETLRRRVLEFEGRQAELSQQLASLKIQVVQAPQLAAEIKATEAALEQTRQQWEVAKSDYEKLSVRSPRDGALFPDRYRLAVADSTQLPSWQGSPLERENLECYLEAGDTLALVGKSDDLEAIVLLSQEDVEQIAPGSLVEMRLEHAPDKLWTGTVRQVARNPVEEIPPAILAEGSISMRIDPSGDARPTDTHYYATVEFEQQPAGVLPDSVGRAKVVLAESTLGRELLRSLRRVFYFEFQR
ncbi:MAG: hypothetical protein RH917_04605 [Lacipirellulaceae bacterium]